MQLFNQNEIKSEPWTFVQNSEEVPASGDIVVSFTRLVAEFKTLMLHPDRLGVTVPNNCSIAELEPYLQRLQLVVLEFPVFTDGRAYSQARTLRNNYSFEGELRASGNLLPDQLSFMHQVGFDYFDIEDERFNLESWSNSTKAISLSYQHTFARHAQTSIPDARER